MRSMPDLARATPERRASAHAGSLSPLRPAAAASPRASHASAASGASASAPSPQTVCRRKAADLEVALQRTRAQLSKLENTPARPSRPHVAKEEALGARTAGLKQSVGTAAQSHGGQFGDLMDALQRDFGTTPVKSVALRASPVKTGSLCSPEPPPARPATWGANQLPPPPPRTLQPQRSAPQLLQPTHLQCQGSLRPQEQRLRPQLLQSIPQRRLPKVVEESPSSSPFWGRFPVQAPATWSVKANSSAAALHAAVSLAALAPLPPPPGRACIA